MNEPLKMGDLFGVTPEEALKPMIGRIAHMEIEGQEVTAKLVFVNHEAVTFKVVPKDTKS